MGISPKKLELLEISNKKQYQNNIRSIIILYIPQLLQTLLIYRSQQKKSYNQYMDLEESKFYNFIVNECIPRNVDLHTSTFYDGFTIKDNNPVNIPQYTSSLKQPLFHIYQTIKYDYDRVKIQDQIHNSILDKMIALLRQGYEKNLAVPSNTKLKQYYLQNQEIVNEYCEKFHPKAWTISVNLYLLGLTTKYNAQKLFKSYHKINGKLQFPLLASQMATISIRNKSEDFYKYFQLAMKYGETIAFNFYAFYQQINGNFQKSYQLFKNAQLLGYKPATLNIAKLFAIGNPPQFPKNPQISVLYFEKVFTYRDSILIDKQGQQFYKFVKNYYKIKQQKALSIISTEQTQAQILSLFILWKQHELKIYEKNNNFYSLGTQNEEFHEESFGILRDKVYYVVFSPLTVHYLRSFLVEDQNGIIQLIELYDWQKIHRDKLKLLHKLGTKIILKQQIRKYSNFTSLPAIRIENSYWIDIIPNQQIHRISNIKIRQFAKILYAKDLFDRCQILYHFLIRRQAEEMDIIYSNLGLIYQNKKMFQKAIDYYKESLRIKDMEKPKQRMFYCYINLNLLNQAQQIIENIKDENICKDLRRILSEHKNKIHSQHNFGLNNFIKKRKPLIGQYETYFKNQFKFFPNQSGRKNFHEFNDYFLTSKDYFVEKMFDGEQLTDENYLDWLKQTYQLPQIQSLTSQNAEEIHQFYQLIRMCQKFRDVDYYKTQEVLNVLYRKLKFLQQRVIKYCMNLQRTEKYQQVLQLYTYGEYMPHSFYIRASQIYRYLGDYKNSIGFCWHHHKLLQEKDLIEYLLSKDKMNNFINQILKSYSKQKYYKQILRFDDGQKFRYQQDDVDHMMKEYYRIRLERVLYFALASYQIKQYEKCKHYIKQIMQQEQLCQFDIYFQCVYIKIKLLLSKKLINESINFIKLVIKKLDKKKYEQYENKYVFKKTFQKEMLLAYIKGCFIQETIIQCQKIVKINQINLIFVQKQLCKFCYKNIKLCVQILQKIKNSEILQCLWQQLYFFLKVYFTQEKIKITEQIRNYFQIEKKQKKKKNKKYRQNQIQNQKLEIKVQIQDPKQNQYTQQLFQDYQQFKKNEIDKNQNNQQQELRLCMDQQNIENQYEQHEGYICDFENNNLRYIVIFNPKMSLPIQQEYHFIKAARRICTRAQGQSGIKIMQDGSLRLKIRHAARLRGKITKQGNRMYCIFDERQGHDSYKRK